MQTLSTIAIAVGAFMLVRELHLIAVYRRQARVRLSYQLWTDPKRRRVALPVVSFRVSRNGQVDCR